MSKINNASLSVISDIEMYAQSAIQELLSVKTYQMSETEKINIEKAKLGLLSAKENCRLVLDANMSECGMCGEKTMRGGDRYCINKKCIPF